jgi:hypothetical protein
MTNPEYILEFMRDNDMRFYTISNTFDREQVREFRDRSLDDAIRAMKKYMKNNTGFHRVNLYQSNELLRGGRPKGAPAVFEVTIKGNEFDEKPPEQEQNNTIGNLINPAQSPSGAIVGVDQYLNVHQLNSDLKAENEKLKMQINYMQQNREKEQQNHEKELESIRKEMENKIKEAQDSNQMFSQGLGLLMQRMGVGE